MVRLIAIILMVLVAAIVIIILWKCGCCKCLQSEEDGKGKHSALNEQTVQALIEAMQIKATAAMSVSADDGNDDTGLLQETKPINHGNTTNNTTEFAEEEDPDDDNELLAHHL